MVLSMAVPKGLLLLAASRFAQSTPVARPQYDSVMSILCNAMPTTDAASNPGCTQYWSSTATSIAPPEPTETPPDACQKCADYMSASSCDGDRDCFHLQCNTSEDCQECGADTACSSWSAPEPPPEPTVAPSACKAMVSVYMDDSGYDKADVLIRFKENDEYIAAVWPEQSGTNGYDAGEMAVGEQQRVVFPSKDFVFTLKSHTFTDTQLADFDFEYDGTSFTWAECEEPSLSPLIGAPSSESRTCPFACGGTTTPDVSTREAPVPTEQPAPEEDSASTRCSANIAIMEKPDMYEKGPVGVRVRLFADAEEDEPAEWKSEFLRSGDPKGSLPGPVPDGPDVEYELTGTFPDYDLHFTYGDEESWNYSGCVRREDLDEWEGDVVRKCYFACEA